MKNTRLILGAIVASAGLSLMAHAADVGVSVNISQPGFFGRIDIGRVPSPVVIYPQPLIIEQHPMTTMREPIYLRVPPGHEKHWDKHCARYKACGQPVYFVQDNWYRDVYAPRHYQEPDRRHGERGEPDQRGDQGDRKRHKKERGQD
jgi:hypothetical protein